MLVCSRFEVDFSVLIEIWEKRKIKGLGSFMSAHLVSFLSPVYFNNYSSSSIVFSVIPLQCSQLDHITNIRWWHVVP